MVRQLARVLLILFLVIGIPFVAHATDMSQFSFEVLVQVQQEVAKELTKRPEWREVTVPQGVWEVGKDIPAGHWLISAYPGTYARVTVGDTLNVSQKTVSWNSAFFYTANVVSPEYRSFKEHSDQPSFDIELKAGLYVVVEHGSVVFSPFIGKPLLGFSSAAYSKAERNGSGISLNYKLEPGLYQIGDEIPGGTYDVRYSDTDEPFILTYSDVLGADGKPDLDFFYSYKLSFSTHKWHGGAHPVIMLDSAGYLLVEGRSCRLYPVEMGY